MMVLDEEKKPNSKSSTSLHRDVLDSCKTKLKYQRQDIIIIIIIIIIIVICCSEERRKPVISLYLEDEMKLNTAECK